MYLISLVHFLKGQGWVEYLVHFISLSSCKDQTKICMWQWRCQNILK